MGVAVSDELLLTAQGLETIERKDENKLRKTCARIEEIIKEYGVEEIVLGLPTGWRKQRNLKRCWSAGPGFW